LAAFFGLAALAFGADFAVFAFGAGFAGSGAVKESMERAQ